eukprot:TRINITY_DN67797_c4_g1_i1.p1 TRINITY_DN67797_c4_g1~~TRINITY_DN67797_c4_g1_i1.p1  ORF type:complete len:361 (+),score=63.28 TRINITY_DN67797_c4_g1_i1:69-1151(+)
MKPSGLIPSFLILLALLVSFVSSTNISFDATYTYDEKYLLNLVTKMSFGHPKQDLELLVGIGFSFDSPSANFDGGAFIIPSVNCKNCQSVHYFNETASFTGRISPGKAPTCWGRDSELAGHMDTDYLAFGDTTLKTMTAFIVQSNKNCKEFDSKGFDGVLQFPPEQYITRNQFLPLALYDSGTISKPWFSIDSDLSDTLRFNMGEVASDSIINWNPLGELYVNWVLNSGVTKTSLAVQVGSFKSKIDSISFSSENFAAYGPESEVQALLKVIGGYEWRYSYYQVDCEKRHTLPPLVFYQDSKPIITLYGEDYTHKLDDVCLVLIRGSSDASTWKIGSRAYRANGVAFDLDQRQIGFYEKK